MFGNVKAIIELIKIILAAYKFIDGQIDDIQFRSKVKERKKVHDEFMEADRKRRLEILRDKVK